MKLKVAVFCCLMYFLYGCNGYQHVATPQYITETSEKGRLFVNVGGIYAQIGYNISSHFNVFSTAFTHSHSSVGIFQSEEKSGVDNYYREITKFTIGSGYFPSDITFKKCSFHFGIQYGLGKGLLNYTHSINRSYTPDINYKAKSYNAFIQPVFGLKAKSVFIAFTGVLTNYNYYNIKTNNTPNDDLDKIFANHNKVQAVYFEPGFFVQVGGRYVKGQTQILIPYELTSTGILSRKFSIFFGVNINLNVFKFPDEVEPKVPKERKPRKSHHHLKKKEEFTSQK